jgi:pimeloyl-ACP methyl ester carboxylesterase
MSKIFLIAGLGADTRLYNNIDLHDHEVIPVDWIEPDENDTLTSYAQKLIYQYNITPNSVVVGTSLGGMIAIEIARQIPLSKAILISSIKSVDEAPRYFALFRNFPAYKIVPNRLMSSAGAFIKPFFVKMNPVDLWLFKDMLKKSSPRFLKWAMSAVLKWNNTVIPPNVYQINGDRDLVFSYKRIKDATIVKGGTHIMVFDRAKEINKLLIEILKKR